MNNIINLKCFHLRKQRLKESHIQLFAQDIPPSLLLVDSVCALQSPNSHFCQMPSDIFLSFANKSKWLLYHKAQHRAPYLCFTSFPWAVNAMLMWKWMYMWHLGFLVWFGDCGRQLWQPFKVTCHCEKAPGMCLEFTGSLWSFQNWCQKVKSDEKWASYEVLKMSNFYQTKQWWRHSHSMIINKSQSVSFLHHTNQNYHPARFLIVINHLIRNTQSFAIFAALPRIFHNFSETPAGPRGGEKKLFLRG